ncbi:(Fe-S)-binding protein [Membranicola marinus]|uniref:(Fe-S)-binding protein n=1 Tax=Membranihabitans marinus TaxID=1227546 RepID=A0A953L9G3_9BACT|nr:(Fe-S)-binding protein [Membranihabitans marinus]MBY5957568.1 (Fe-S)-binding protein [Membranihabitans marinus]
MKIGLFVPCYIDQFYPDVGKATLLILENLGYEVTYPLEQSCCGQPMVNSGFVKEGGAVTKNFRKVFRDCDVVVGPSGSCVHHLVDHEKLGQQSGKPEVYELFSFLHAQNNFPRSLQPFPHRVGLHYSCHALRGLNIASPSELVEPYFSKIQPILDVIPEMEIVPLDNVDECCGFGGTFSVFESAVSIDMGERRVEDHVSHGAEYVVSMDSSCLMHMEGVARKQKQNVRFLHLAELVAKLWER